MSAARSVFYLQLFGAGLLASSARFGRNLFRVFRGRRWHARDNSASWRLLYHALHFRRLGFVTHEPEEGEGAASQAFGTLLAKALSLRLGVPYAHTPLANIAHAEGGDELYAQQWERTLNLGSGERGLPEETVHGLDIGAFYQTDLYTPGIRRLLFNTIFEMAPQLRARFDRRGKQPERTFVVAMHLRRGDVSEHRNCHLWTPPAQARACVEQVIDCLQTLGVAYELIVVSQGKADDFPELDGLPCTLFLNEPAPASFRRLVEANILIMAKSGFSQLAGLLSAGVVLYLATPYPAMPEWLDCPDGNVDQGELARRVAEAASVGK